MDAPVAPYAARLDTELYTDMENYGQFDLIRTVITYAIYEGASFRKPRGLQDIIVDAKGRRAVRLNHREVRACKARKWINTRNSNFSVYCDLLGWDARWVRRKCNEYFARVDNHGPC